MTATIAGHAYPFLYTAQPFGYLEGETQQGLTARRWTLQGLLSGAEWSTLLTGYNTWRDARITDQDTLLSGAVGTTVTLSISANGVSVSNVACWYSQAPTGTQVGNYVEATVELVDANQQLAVLLRTKEKGRQAEEAMEGTYGTLTFGSAVVTLTQPADGRVGGPTIGRSAAGKSVIEGPYTASSTRRVVGYISSGTPADLRSWYDTTLATTSTGTWYPDGDLPPPRGEVIISGGVKSTRYSVEFAVRQLV